MREEKECCRTIHLQSGLPYELHTYSYPFACLSMSFDRKAPKDEGKTQWEAATKAPFEGMRLCFGQLMYYRRKAVGKRTLEPNMAPGLFMGWRIDSGLRYRNVVRVLDYAEFRTSGNHVVIDVPEVETYVEAGPPIFPIAHARDKALREGSAAPDALPSYDLKEVPFPVEGGIAAPSTPVGPKSRRVYITADRIIKWKETPGCKACKGMASKHTDECRERFSRLVEAERKEAEDAAILRASAAISGSAIPPPAAPSKAPPHLEEKGAAEGAPEVHAGAASVRQDATRVIDLARGVPACFGMPAIHQATTVATSQEPPGRATKGMPNKRSRKRAKQSGSKQDVFIEFACAPDSSLGVHCQRYGIPFIRLSKEHTDLLDPNTIDQLIEQVKGCQGRPNLWSSIPCTSGSPWQYVNRAQYGESFRKRHMKQEWESRKMFRHFTRVAEVVLQQGGTVSFEWPKGCSAWKRPDVAKFFRDEIYQTAMFDGCMFGLTAKDGGLIRKPWKVVSTSRVLVNILSDELHTCSGLHTHTRAEGAETTRTAYYPPEMCESILRGLYNRHIPMPFPAMPCVPITGGDQGHREKEQQLKHVSALAGVVDDALVFDDDVEASSKVAEICNLSSLLVEAYKEENADASVTQCFAAVTKLLSRAEMLADPAALKAVQDEARGLEAAGTWDLESVREYADVKAEAQKSGISVHFGQLMSIASIKFWELAKHLQKTKGRIVYRGDCAKDENGAAAVYQELGANPTSVQGLNACIAYGSAPGHICTAADAVKAYVQAFLKSKHKTWIDIELSPELRPKWWREKFVRPVVLLIRALYGHPDAGGLWEAHLKEVLKGLGGVEIQEYPGNFWFAEDRLMLSTYVDDLTLAGPRAAHAPFWEKLCALVNVEPPEPIYRILGRNHVYLEHTLLWRRWAFATLISPVGDDVVASIYKALVCTYVAFINDLAPSSKSFANHLHPGINEFINPAKSSRSPFFASPEPAPEPARNLPGTSAEPRRNLLEPPETTRCVL